MDVGLRRLEMKAWKVLKKVNNEFHSCFANGKARKIYKQGVKNHPPKWLAKDGYGLLVFENRAFARKFKRTYCYHTIIIKVETGNRMRLRPILEMSTLLYGEKQRIASPVADWPDGTMMVEWVKIPFNEEGHFRGMNRKENQKNDELEK